MTDDRGMRLQCVKGIVLKRCGSVDDFVHSDTLDKIQGTLDSLHVNVAGIKDNMLINEVIQIIFWRGTKCLRRG